MRGIVIIAVIATYFTASCLANPINLKMTSSSPLHHFPHDSRFRSFLPAGMRARSCFWYPLAEMRSARITNHDTARYDTIPARLPNEGNVWCSPFFALRVLINTSGHAPNDSNSRQSIPFIEFFRMRAMQHRVSQCSEIGRYRMVLQYRMVSFTSSIGWCHHLLLELLVLKDSRTFLYLRQGSEELVSTVMIVDDLAWPGLPQGYLKVRWYLPYPYSILSFSHMASISL